MKMKKGELGKTAKHEATDVATTTPTTTTVTTTTTASDRKTDFLTAREKTNSNLKGIMVGAKGMRERVDDVLQALNKKDDKQTGIWDQEEKIKLQG